MTPNRLGVAWALAAAISLSVLSGAARAETDAERGLAIYKRGLSLFGAGDYTAAAQEFEKAYALSRHPNNLYYLGECQRRLGELRASYDSYRKFAETQGPEKRAELMGKLERMRWERRCRVSVSSAPGGAEVSLDGKRLGVTPRDGSALQLEIAGGRHVFRVTRDGHDAAEKELAAELGEPIALSFALRAVRPPASAASRPACPAPPAERACPSCDRCRSRRAGFLLGSAISTTLLSAGALAVGIAYNKKYNDDFEGSPNLHTYQAVSAVGYALAAIFAGASATTFWLYYRELKRGELERKPSLAVAPMVDRGAQLVVVGSF